MNQTGWRSPMIAMATGLVVLAVAFTGFKVVSEATKGTPRVGGKSHVSSSIATHPPHNSSGQPAASKPPTPSSSGPGGVTISVFTGGNPATVISMLNASPVRISVVSWVFLWDAIEPLDSRYNWARVDAAVAAATASGRKSYLRVVAGIHSPLWVYAAGVPAITVPGSCFAGDPNRLGTVRMPATWSAPYIAKWTAFIRTMGARYNSNPNLFAVSIGGGGYLGEMQLPHCPSLLQQYGYSDASLLTAWKQFESAGRSAFPNHATSLAIEEPLGFRTSNVLPSLMAYARASFGSRLWIQQNGLRDSTNPYSGGSYALQLETASVYTTVGWQMWSGGNTAAQLRAAFRTAIMTHSTFVEVYLSDVVNPLNAQALRYLTLGRI